MYFLKLIILFILFLSQLNSKELEKISLQLDWLHQFQFAGYYMAKEKGYYKDKNLNVSIKEFNSNTNLVDDILKSKSDYAVGKSSLIIDSLENKKIVLLSAMYQSSPMVLISLKKSKINTPKELLNKSVMLTQDAREAASINSMIISQGLKLKDINFRVHSFNLDDLINEKIDVMGSYLSNEPFLLEEKNIDFSIQKPSDYGFNFYGGILFTSKKELDNNPLRVKKFYHATLKGWKYAFSNIEETAQFIFDNYNTQNKTLKSLIYEGKVLKELARVNEGLLGNINSSKIEEIKRLYLLLGLVKNNKNFKIDELIYNPNKVNLNKEEKDYLKKNKIVLLTDSNFPPFTMNKDNLTGIEIDYWDLINKKLNKLPINIKIIEENKTALSIIKNSPNNVKYAFNQNDINNFTKETNTIGKIKVGIVTLMDKPFVHDITELSNKKIAISEYSSLYKQYKSKYPEIEYVLTKNLEESLKLISEKKVYGVIDKLPSLSYFITKKSLTNLKISGVFSKNFNIKLLVNKNNKILFNILNKVIAAITKEEKNEINSKYYSIIYQTSIDYSWLYKIVPPLLIIIFFIAFTNRKLNDEIKKRKTIEEELNKVANIDSLTNIFNRRKIESIYEKEIIRIKRYKRELSVIFFDIDNFKQINDKFGHSIGDEVLVRLASIVKTNIRTTDYFGRWGGEEFIIILPETNKEKATNVAFILIDKINSSDFDIEKKVTCSFGVSQFEETDSADTLLTRVDNAMYYVKRNGKNSVKIV